MVKCRYIFLLLFVSYHSYAQQNNLWYFGRKAALDFNQQPTRILTNSVMNANEGSASICNTAGDLLFYTNGTTIYNSNHLVMLNGDGLLGNVSTVQSSVIVPMPGNSNLYFVFTADAIENDFANGYNYSIVDMAGDGGKGAVVSKNILLSAPGTERMTAARHADGISVWLITNDKDSRVFRAWLISCSGLQAAPVVSTVGVQLDQDFLQSVGMMKVSPDGKQLCQTHFPSFDRGISLPNFFQLFDFDNVTGVVSNPRRIDIPDTRVTGCEYSPNSKLLYLARPYDNAIDQVEATLATPAAIVASRFTILTGPAAFRGIQLAPDQKIYLSQDSRFLAAINYPDVQGTGCTYQPEQIDVSGGLGHSGYLGLPSFINDLSFDGSNGFTHTITDSCTGTVRFNGYSTMAGTLSWDWDFGDGSASTLQNPVHSFSPANPQYIVKLRIQSSTGCGQIERQNQIIPQGLMLNPDFDFVAKCDSGYVRFTNTTIFFPDTARIQYQWDFGDASVSSVANPIHNYANGSFDVRMTVKTTTACLDKSTVKTVNLEPVIVQASPDMEIDVGATAQLTATGNGTIFRWTPPAGLSSTIVANPAAKPSNTTLYIVTAFNDAGCSGSDSVLVKVKTATGIYVPTGFTPNNDGRNDVFMPILSDEYTLKEFSIYNRWGQKIFTTSQLNAGWNGKINGIAQNSGVYVWIVKAIDTRTNKKEEKKGTFVILR